MHQLAWICKKGYPGCSRERNACPSNIQLQTFGQKTYLQIYFTHKTGAEQGGSKNIL